MENNLKVSYTIKHALTVGSSNPIPKNKNLRSQENMHVNIYSNFIQNHQKLETTQYPFSWWADKQIVTDPHNGILFSKKIIYWYIQQKKWISNALTKWKGQIQEATYTV